MRAACNACAPLPFYETRGPDASLPDRRDRRSYARRRSVLESWGSRGRFRPARLRPEGAVPVSTSSSPLPGAGGGASAPLPAYAAAPRRGGLFVALAAIVALAALGALAVFLIGGRAPATAPPESAPGTRDADAA